MPTPKTGEKAQSISPIPQIAGYGATADGRIWSLASNWRGYGVREISPTPNGRGYLKVRVMLGGKRRNLPIHRLIAATFLPIKPGADFEICHKNGNPLDNRAENLCWGTRSDNALDRVKHGRTYRPDWSDMEKRQRWSKAISKGVRAAIAKAEGK